MLDKAVPEYMKAAGGDGTAIATVAIKTLGKPEMENPRLAGWLGIERYPTLYLIGDGQIVSRKPSEGGVAEQVKDIQDITAAK